MENIARLYTARYKATYALYLTDRHDECMEQFEAMTWDPYMPLWFRLKIHDLLASGIGNTIHAREQLDAAEDAYAEICRRWPEGTPGQEGMHRKLRKFREEIDACKRDLDEEEQALIAKQNAEADIDQAGQTETADERSPEAEEPADEPEDDEQLQQLASSPNEDGGESQPAEVN